MSHRVKFTDLFFESGRHRLGQNLFFKLGMGCLSLLFLLCCAVICFFVWYFWTFFSAFPFRRDTRPRPELVFSPATLPAATVGTPYDVAIHISQNVTPTGKFTLSEGDQLPPGLSLAERAVGDAVHITGTPEKAGTYTFTVNVWCYGTSVNGQRGSKEYTITVNP